MLAAESTSLTAGLGSRRCRARMTHGGTYRRHPSACSGFAIKKIAADGGLACAVSSPSATLGSLNDSGRGVMVEQQIAVDLDGRMRIERLARRLLISSAMASSCSCE